MLVKHHIWTGKGSGSEIWLQTLKQHYLYTAAALTYISANLVKTRGLQEWENQIYGLPGQDGTQQKQCCLTSRASAGLSGQEFELSLCSLKAELLRTHWGTMNREPSDNIFIVALLTMGTCISQGDSGLCLISVLKPPPAFITASIFCQSMHLPCWNQFLSWRCRWEEGCWRLEEQDTLQHPSYLPSLPHREDFGRTCCHLGLGASYDHLPK